MQSSTSYPVKVNCARATIILDPLSDHVAGNTKKVVSNSNNGLKVSQVGWFCCLGTEKLYEFMVVYFAETKDTDLLISRDFIKISRETAYTKTFQDQNPDKKRCFNYQQYGYRVSKCNKIPVCGNCFFPSYSHRNSQEPQVHYSNSGGNHLVNSFQCLANPSIRYFTSFPI